MTKRNHSWFYDIQRTKMFLLKKILDVWHCDCTSIRENEEKIFLLQQVRNVFCIYVRRIRFWYCKKFGGHCYTFGLHGVCLSTKFHSFTTRLVTQIETKTIRNFFCCGDNNALLKFRFLCDPLIFVAGFKVQYLVCLLISCNVVTTRHLAI